jgi:hypothetical protein
MSPSTADPELLNHYSVAIYPFLHDLTPANRDARLAAVADRWAPWWSRLDDSGLADALDATAFFLPFVRSLLYPEVTALHDAPPGPRYQHWTELVREWVQPGLAAFTRHLPPSSILRLSSCEEAFRTRASFHVFGRRSASDPNATFREYPACLDWVDALLFPSGLGFVLLKFRLRNERARLSQLIELNQAMRLVHPPSLAWCLPALRLADGRMATVRELMNHLTEGLVRQLGEGPATPYTDTEPGLAYGERCQLLSYACVHLPGSDTEALPAGAFASGEDRLLFEYAAGIGLGQSVEHPMWVPSPEQAERVRRENRLAMWRCWKAMALKESCVFLGTEDLSFNRRSLPHTIEHDYLPLYLYTLYQKFQLMIFANDLMREVAQVESHLRGARALLRRFVAFRNRFWFSEVTRKPQGGDLYRLMQQSMDVPGLYQMALASVKEAKEYYEDRWDRQVRLGVTILGLGGPAAAALGTLQPVLGGLPLLGMAAALAALVGAGALWLIRRPRRPMRGKRGGESRPRLLPFVGRARGESKAA